MRLSALLGLLLLATAADATVVARGPYLQLLTDSSVIVRWRTDVATDSRVIYGAAPGTLTESVVDGDLVTEHELEITGLAAASRYFYAVGSSSEVLAGGDEGHSFETAPASGPAVPLRVWVLGDSGTGDTSAEAVRDAFLALPRSETTDLVLTLGDNAYESGTDAQFQNGLFDVYPTVLRTVPFWPSFGNHDGQSADSATESGPYYDVFTLPRAGEAGGVASGTEAYYSFDFANVHFVCLDSDESDRSTDGAMLGWLALDLAATTQDWIVAFWHHPPYSKGGHDSDAETAMIEMRENAASLLESYGVDLVLGGHSHGYERSFLIDGHYGAANSFQESMKVDGGDGRESGDGAYAKSGGAHQGAVYVVAGASGKLTPGPFDHPAMFLSLAELGSLVLDVYGNRLDAFYVSDDGTVSDRFTVLKGTDLYAPLVLGARATAESTIEVAFNEPLAPSSAEEPNHYAIAPAVSVLSATLLADGRTVELETAPLTEGQPYTLTVEDISDPAANAVDPPQQAAFLWIDTIEATFQDAVAPEGSYSGTRDTFLEQAAPAVNHGSEGTLQVDGDDGGGQDLAALLRWDLSSIPTDAIVDQVSIGIYVTNASSDGYELYELLRAWAEDEATWESAAAGSPWEVPGAAGSGDRGSEVLGTLFAGSGGSYSRRLDEAGRAVVQGWVASPGTNRGFLVADTSENDGLDFASREGSALDHRPALTVVYHLPFCSAADGVWLLLEADTVSSTQAFEVCGTIAAQAGYSVSATGELMLRAGDSVAFGNGFSVETGGKLAVELDGSL